MNFANYNPGAYNQGPLPANAPYQSDSAYNSFYAGVNPNQNMPGMVAAPTDIESRLAKMERQISRLEHRVNKLETTNTTFVSDDYESTTNNMYML